jgi:hypothetical protein
MVSLPVAVDSRKLPVPLTKLLPPVAATVLVSDTRRVAPWSPERTCVFDAVTVSGEEVTLTT